MTLLYREAIAVISYENLQLQVKLQVTYLQLYFYKKDTITKFLLLKQLYKRLPLLNASLQQTLLLKF